MRPVTCFRIFNALTDGIEIDVMINEYTVSNNLCSNGVSCYFFTLPGLHKIKIKSRRFEHAIIIDQSIEFIDQGIYTIVVFGTVKNAAIESIYDKKRPHASEGRVRFVNLSKFMQNIIINHNPLLSELATCEVTTYYPLKAGSYHVNARPNHPDIKASVKKINIHTNQYTSVFLIDTPRSFRTRIISEGTSYLNLT